MPIRLLFPLISFLWLSPLTASIAYPQLALGGGYDCVLLISNKTDLRWQGKLRAYRGNHSPWAVNWSNLGFLDRDLSEFGLGLPAGTTRKIVISSEAELSAGYLLIDAEEGHSEDSIAVSFFYTLSSADGSLEDSVGIPRAAPGQDFVLPVESSSSVDTGLAWAASKSVDRFPISLTLVRLNGTIFGKKDWWFSGHSSQFFTEIFETLTGDFLGKLIIESPEPILVTALRLEAAGDVIQLTGTPPETVNREHEGHSLEIVEDSVWLQQVAPDWYKITGKLVNRNSKDSTFTYVSAAVYDAAGDVVGGDWAFARGETRRISSLNTNTCLVSGGEGYFDLGSIFAWGVPESLDLLVFASSMEETVAPLGRAEVTDHRIEDSGGNAEIIGQIRNAGTVPIEFGWLEIILLDASGRILDIYSMKPDREQLAPAETTTFVASTDTPYSLVTNLIFSPDWDDIEQASTALNLEPGTNPRENSILKKLKFFKQNGAGSVPMKMSDRLRIRVSDR